MLDDPRKMTAALRRPTERLPDLLSGRHNLRPLLLRVVLPLCGIRPLALLLRAALAHTSLAVAAVLALSALVLQLAAYVALALALPWLMRLFGLHLAKRRSLALGAVMGAPLWLSGVLFVLPDEHQAVLLATRLTVALLASYGVVLLWLAMPMLDVPRPLRLPVVLLSGATFCVVYLAMFVALGIVANVVLYTFGLGG